MRFMEFTNIININQGLYSKITA